MAKSILIINEDEEEIKELQNFFAAEGSTVFCVKQLMMQLLALQTMIYAS